MLTNSKLVLNWIKKQDWGYQNFPIGFEGSKVPRIYVSAILSGNKSSASTFYLPAGALVAFTGWSVIGKVYLEMSTKPLINYNDIMSYNYK